MEEATDITAYVRAAANLQGLGLDDAELDRVTAAFALVVRFAEPVLNWPVDPAVEPALVFRP